jgi:hypothetical protein
MNSPIEFFNRTGMRGPRLKVPSILDACSVRVFDLFGLHPARAARLCGFAMGDDRDVRDASAPGLTKPIATLGSGGRLFQ